MDRFEIGLVRDSKGKVPFEPWFGSLDPKVKAKVLTRLRRLEELGNALHRPEADFLRDGIYELRVAERGTQYRILYFFHGKAAIIVTHGLVKEREVPGIEIQRAVRYREHFLQDPRKNAKWNSDEHGNE